MSIIINMINHKEEAPHWINGDVPEADLNQREQLRKKQAGSLLSASEADQLHKLNQQIADTRAVGAVTKTVRNAVDTFYENTPAGAEQKSLADLREELNSGQLGRALMARYMSEELFYLLLAP